MAKLPGNPIYAAPFIVFVHIVVGRAGIGYRGYTAW